MQISLNRFLLRLSVILLLSVGGGHLFAQQPTSPRPTTPVPTIDPATVTPEQVQEIRDQIRESDQRNAEEAANRDQQDERENDQADDKNQEKEKRQKVANEVKTQSGLPIFGNEIFNNPTSTFAPNNNRPVPVNYILGPGDHLSIAVTGNSVVNFNPVVSPDGSITLREFGKVFVGGRTLENATEVIKNKLRANRFAVGNGTDVDVTVTDIRSIRVTILGQVRTPGDYNLSSLTTVFNALYESGGITNNGTFRGIQVIRNSEQIAQIDMYDYLLRGDLSSNITLKDGDIIMVPEYRVRVSMEGEVKRPAYFEVLPGESLRDVIHFAGGFTDYAYRFSIKAVQLTEKQQRLRDIDQKDFDVYIPLKGDKYIFPGYSTALRTGFRLRAPYTALAITSCLTGLPLRS